jgi:hypothetical protein
MKPWRVDRRVVADSHHFAEEQDPDPHLNEKSDPHLHLIEKMDPDPRQSDADPQTWHKVPSRIVFRKDHTHFLIRIRPAKKVPDPQTTTMLFIPAFEHPYL